MNNIITIDGPSASGKGTIAKQISKKLGFAYLDSGALYRIIAYLLIKNDFTLLNMDKLIEKFHNSNINFDNYQILLNNQDISKDIVNEDIGSLASKLASKADIRNELLIWQRNFAINKDLITDGRDMGTVVFPQAKCKIFLIADINKRANRRYLQLQEQNINTTLDEVLQALSYRDERDTTRTLSPLIPAADAVTIDNTDLTIYQTSDKIIEIFNNS